MPKQPYTAVSKKSGKTYYLHSRLQPLKGGRTVTLFYFAGVPGKAAIDALPAGMEVGENGRTGLPFLRKIK